MNDNNIIRGKTALVSSSFFTVSYRHKRVRASSGAAWHHSRTKRSLFVGKSNCLARLRRSRSGYRSVATDFNRKPQADLSRHRQTGCQSACRGPAPDHAQTDLAFQSAGSLSLTSCHLTHHKPAANASRRSRLNILVAKQLINASTNIGWTDSLSLSKNKKQFHCSMNTALVHCSRNTNV